MLLHIPFRLDKYQMNIGGKKTTLIWLPKKKKNKKKNKTKQNKTKKYKLIQKRNLPLLFYYVQYG